MTEDHLAKNRIEVAIINIIVGIFVGLIPVVAIGVAHEYESFAIPMVMFVVAVGIVWWRIHRTYQVNQ